jgi:hypothetical protein
MRIVCVLNLYVAVHCTKENRRPITLVSRSGQCGVAYDFGRVVSISGSR